MHLMRLDEVMKATGLGRSSIYKQMYLGQFPRQVSIGGRAVAWVSDEVGAWVADRINQRDSEGSRP